MGWRSFQSWFAYQRRLAFSSASSFLPLARFCLRLFAGYGIGSGGVAEISFGQDATAAQLVLHVPEVIARKGMQHDVVGVSSVRPDG